MRQRTFVWSLGTVKGSEPGWLPVNAGEGWFPGPGFLTAHDTMEHMSDKPDWAHELRAAGVAAYLVDGVKHRSMESIADDVVGFAARDHLFEAPTAPAFANKPLPAADEAQVQKLVAAIRKQVTEGVAKARLMPLERKYREAADRSPLFADKATPWIRLGYRAAMRVYGAGQGEATGLFMDRVRDAINRDHDRKRPIKGDKLEVAVDPKAKTFTLNRVDVEKLTLAERKHRAFVDEFAATVFGAGVLA